MTTLNPNKPLEISLPRATVDQPDEWDSIVNRFVEMSKKALSSENLAPLAGIKRLKELKTYCIPVYRQFDVPDIIPFIAKIDLAALAILELCYQDMGESQVVELLSTLPNSQDPEDLKFITFLWRKHRTENVLKAFANWIESSENFTLYQLMKYWPLEDVVRLVPYLTAIDFYGITSSRDIAGLIHAAAGSSNTKKMTFSGQNTINEEVADALSSCNGLEELKIQGCAFAKDVKISFDGLFNLRKLQLHAAKNFNQAIDLNKCSKLTFMKLSSCDEFNGQILFPKPSALESFSISFCQLWNQALDFSSCHQLKKLTINLSRTWNQPVDLRLLINLEQLKIKSCVEWNALLLFPGSDNKLQKVAINDCRKYDQTISFKSSPYLKEVSLAGCHLFNQPFELDSNVELNILNLRNCLAWNQATPRVKVIEHLIIKNCKAFTQNLPEWIKIIER